MKALCFVTPIRRIYVESGLLFLYIKYGAGFKDTVNDVVLKMLIIYDLMTQKFCRNAESGLCL